MFLYFILFFCIYLDLVYQVDQKCRLMKFEEQSSYSAMLNMAESVPSTEPVPSNSRNSGIQFKRHHSQFRNRTKLELIPGVGRNRTEFRNRTKLELIPGVERNRTEFRNRTKLERIPGIGRSRTEFQNYNRFPEFGN